MTNENYVVKFSDGSYYVYPSMNAMFTGTANCGNPNWTYRSLSNDELSVFIRRELEREEKSPAFDESYDEEGWANLMRYYKSIGKNPYEYEEIKP